MQKEHRFQRVREILSHAQGSACGVTINNLAEACDCSRRTMEHLLETRLYDLPFLVVSHPSWGYFQPQTDAEVNACLSSIRGRHEPLVRRDQYWTKRWREARRFHSTYDGRHFSPTSSNRQPELFNQEYYVRLRDVMDSITSESSS
jgi:hypothetical protein